MDRGVHLHPHLEEQQLQYSGRTEVQSVQYGKEKANKDRVFASRNSAFTQEGARLRPSSVGHLVDHVVHTSPSEVFANHRSPSSTQANSIILESSPSQETPIDGQPPALPPKQSKKNSWNQIHYSHSQQELDNHINETFDVPASPEKSTPNGGVPHDNLVLIRMKPDENGRFGFNVKGGYDQKMPVIVSRVAPGTPADLCVPRLNEGDQVVLINGRDIAEHTHDQVVMFIKESCERHSGELVLLVRPNAVYDVVEEKLESEPDFQYIPEKSPLDGVHQDDDALRESMIQLAEGLITGTILAQFDQLYRKKPGMTMSCAKLPQNISKNRYRDISPYDATRVILKSNDDYINANYINMEISSSSIINQYIACQGPLPNTCPDFWQMTWEQGSSMVVMLTTQVERGRVKCHQYWPEPTGSSSYGNFQITCHSEEGNPAYVFREMTLTNLEKNETRQLTQIQYVAWPDHGVPDDSSDFLDFVCLVRKKRAGREEPVVVHCRAKKDCEIRLKAFLMESALTPALEQRSDLAPSTVVSVRSAPPAPSTSRHRSPAKKLKKAGCRASVQVERCNPPCSLPGSLDTEAGLRQLQVTLTSEALQAAQEILMLVLLPTLAPSVPRPHAPDEAITEAHHPVPQDDTTAHQELLKRVASNLGLQEDKEMCGDCKMQIYSEGAGIGRTGVLITMETAMCLIECNQPVYPLDIVRTMRDQRAMMIQTPVSIILATL
ncbi:Tyrosine-protein phosphatase non-receptor type 4 [Chelonia mydas]|uniref:Tyrosine-protein phosphatase non-receptor type 4 n=1 Tax=Chelonia mydas TaxID=8469 RepID=M7BB48_CHEMY|nr:Tyrosine-protein phosphatase non-receptor type 4 [Chelonia mydas]